MTSTKTDRKGQLSLDLALAIILVLAIFSSVLSYSETLQSSIEPGRTLMGLNMVADYTTGLLTTFYNSVVSLNSANSLYSLRFPDTYSPDSKYAIDYNITFDCTGTTCKLEFNNLGNVVNRTLNFKITGAGCNKFNLSLAGNGHLLHLNECGLSGPHLSCNKCQLT